MHPSNSSLQSLENYLFFFEKESSLLTTKTTLNRLIIAKVIHTKVHTPVTILCHGRRDTRTKIILHWRNTIVPLHWKRPLTNVARHWREETPKLLFAGGNTHPNTYLLEQRYTRATFHWKNGPPKYLFIGKNRSPKYLFIGRNHTFRILHWRQRRIQVSLRWKNSLIQVPLFWKKSHKHVTLQWRKHTSKYVFTGGTAQSSTSSLTNNIPS